MADISKIKIDNTTYNIKDLNAIKSKDAAIDPVVLSTGAVRFDETQTLTDSQKAQARSNIGASPRIIKTTMDSVANVDTEYYLGEQSSVNITMPTSVSIGQNILVCFSSGATACTLTCDLQGFSFVPKANKTSWLKFTYCSTDNWLVETKEG